MLGRLKRFGHLWLVVCETAFCLPDGSLPDGAPSENPFDLRTLRCQLVEAERTLFSNDWGRACARVLTVEDAPRWLLLVADSRGCLLDRNTYAQGRHLAFDLGGVARANDAGHYGYSEPLRQVSQASSVKRFALACPSRSKGKMYWPQRGEERENPEGVRLNNPGLSRVKPG